MNEFDIDKFMEDIDESIEENALPRAAPGPMSGAGPLPQIHQYEAQEEVVGVLEPVTAYIMEVVLLQCERQIAQDILMGNSTRDTPSALSARMLWEAAWKRSQLRFIIGDDVNENS